MNINYENIKEKEFSVVGLRHNEGENAFIMSKTGILYVENNNIVLKTTDGQIVGSIVSSTQKIDELRDLGIKNNALTSQKALDGNKNVFEGCIVEMTEYIPNVCVVIKIMAPKADVMNINITEAIKNNENVGRVCVSLDQLNESTAKAKEEFPKEWEFFLGKNLSEDLIGSMINALRDMDSYFSMQYLCNEIDISTLEYIRLYCTMPAYYLYKYCIEDISFEQFFSPVTMLAEEKYEREDKH